MPISALVFGGRRKELAPLVYEAKELASTGYLVGAGVASETTAANVGEVGIVRRDPMAMKPFCGYNFADYWAPLADVRGTIRKICRRSFTSTGSARIMTANSCGPALVKTCVYYAGLLIVARAELRRAGHQLDTCRKALISTPMISISMQKHWMRCYR